jgi:molybdopterin converting factor small subunit
VTACDSAFLNPRLVSYLVSQAAEYDIVVPHWEGRFQPLHAVYRRSVLPHLEEQLARNELRPVYLFDKVRTRTVREDEIRRFDPDGSSFFNMNTPEDYATALRRWEESSIECTVELFGVARLVAHTKEVSLVLPRGATLGHMVSALADKLPELVGRVISRDRRSLGEGYACNVNGLDFVRSSAASVHDGDNIVILSADAGG